VENLKARERTTHCARINSKVLLDWIYIKCSQMSPQDRLNLTTATDVIEYVTQPGYDPASMPPIPFTGPRDIQRHFSRPLLETFFATHVPEKRGVSKDSPDFWKDTGDILEKFLSGAYRPEPTVPVNRNAIVLTLYQNGSVLTVEEYQALVGYLQRSIVALEAQISSLKEQLAEAQAELEIAQDNAEATQVHKAKGRKRKSISDLGRTQLVVRLEQCKKNFTDLTGEDLSEIVYQELRRRGTPTEPQPLKLDAKLTWQMQCRIKLTEQQLDDMRLFLKEMDAPLTWVCARTARKFKNNEKDKLASDLDAKFSPLCVLFDLISVLRFACKLQFPSLRRANSYELLVKVTEDGRRIAGRSEVVLSTSPLKMTCMTTQEQLQPIQSIQSHENVFPLAAYDGKEDTTSMFCARNTSGTSFKVRTQRKACLCPLS
jgi:hypothetical protein